MVNLVPNLWVPKGEGKMGASNHPKRLPALLEVLLGVTESTQEHGDPSLHLPESNPRSFRKGAGQLGAHITAHHLLSYQSNFNITYLNNKRRRIVITTTFFQRPISRNKNAQTICFGPENYARGLVYDLRLVILQAGQSFLHICLFSLPTMELKAKSQALKAESASDVSVSEIKINRKSGSVPKKISQLRRF